MKMQHVGGEGVQLPPCDRPMCRLAVHVLSFALMRGRRMSDVRRSARTVYSNPPTYNVNSHVTQSQHSAGYSASPRLPVSRLHQIAILE